MVQRVVITGLGAVTPIGTSVKVAWNNLLQGHTAVRNLLNLPAWQHLHPQLSSLPSHLAAPVLEIPPSQSSNTSTSLSTRFKLPRSFHFAELAAAEALNDSGLTSHTVNDDIGVFFGCGMPGVSEIYETAPLISNKMKISPYFIPSILGNSPAAHISRKFGLKGPISSPSLACATGSYAIGEAFRFLRDESSEVGGCEIILAGASEAPLSAPSFAGFSRLKALSTSNQTPLQASRPFDKSRNGFVLGEGAGVLVLERLSSALKRNARIYAEIIGFGSSSDAFHPTAPDPSNYGAIKCIKTALNTKIHHSLVAVNAHATSTPLGDEIELSALEKSLSLSRVENKISIYSNKGAIGHLLGASGTVESIFTVLCLHNLLLPPNLNLTNPLPIHNFNLFELPTTRTELPESIADCCSILKTSFGFGGVNVALLFKRFQEN